MISGIIGAIQSKNPIAKRLIIMPIIIPLSRGFSLQEGLGRQIRSTKKPMNLFKALIASPLFSLAQKQKKGASIFKIYRQLSSKTKDPPAPKHSRARDIVSSSGKLICRTGKSMYLF